MFRLTESTEAKQNEAVYGQVCRHSRATGRLDRDDASLLAGVRITRLAAWREGRESILNSLTTMHDSSFSSALNAKKGPSTGQIRTTSVNNARQGWSEPDVRSSAGVACLLPPSALAICSRRNRAHDLTQERIKTVIHTYVGIPPGKRFRSGHAKRRHRNAQE